MAASSMTPELFPLIEQHLETFFDKMVRKGFGFSVDMSRYQFSTGGKRLRASIPGWVYAACGADPVEAIPLGCALELIHNATLVHDDLQDGDTVRRGKPTVWKRWSSAQAINCGDALFQFATAMVCEMKLEGSVLTKILRCLSEGSLQVIEGQAQEFLVKEEFYPAWARYLGVVRGKTAALIAASVTTALIALDASGEVIRASEDASMEAGVLFQLQDDLLDLYGEKGRERRGSDIAEGKVSALIALLNDRASLGDREAVNEILRKPRDLTTDADISDVMGLLDHYRIREIALAEIASIQTRLDGHELARIDPSMHRMILEMSSIFMSPIVPEGEPVEWKTIVI